MGKKTEQEEEEDSNKIMEELGNDTNGGIYHTLKRLVSSSKAEKLKLYLKCCQELQSKQKNANEKGAGEMIDLPSILNGTWHEISDYPLITLAAHRNNLAAVEALSSYDCDFNATRKIGNQNGVYISCERNNVAMLKLFLQKGGDQNIVSSAEPSWTPLMVAAQNGNLETIKLLLNVDKQFGKIAKPFDWNGLINHCDDNGYSLLHILCQKGYLNIIQYFLSIQDRFEVKIDMLKKSVSGFSPLMCACNNNHASTVNFLLKYFHTNKSDDKPMFDINDVSETGRSVLWMCCWNNNASSVRCMFETYANEIDVDKSDKYNKSPLYAACEKNASRCLNLLINHGLSKNKIDMNRKDEQMNKLTPLMVAASSYHQPSYLDTC